MSGEEARIVAVVGTLTHDAESAFLITLGFPGGGESRLQISGPEAAEVVRRAAVSEPQDLVGLPWTLLQLRPVAFRR